MRYNICPIGTMSLPIFAVLGMFALAPELLQSDNPHEDCLTYDPTQIRIERANGAWGVLDSPKHILASFSSGSDAKIFVELVRQKPIRCFIGRHSQRPEREKYIVQYWKASQAGTAKEAAVVLPDGDCTPYDPTTLAIGPLADSAWRVSDSGKKLSLLADSRDDANRIEALARSHSAVCFIGRHLGASLWDIVEYWK